MEPIDEINQNYPCDKRGGYGTKGCACDGGQVEVDKTKVKCLYYGRAVRITECKNCSRQRTYVRHLQEKK